MAELAGGAAMRGSDSRLASILRQALRHPGAAAQVELARVLGAWGADERPEMSVKPAIPVPQGEGTLGDSGDCVS